MATAIFSAVGQAEGGQAGAAIGSLAGGLIDNALTAPTSAALRVQSAAYGEAIPRLYGTIRISGGILWSTGLREEGAGLDKLSGGGGRTYSTRLAIGISARRIQGIGRIWADGKLIRDPQGQMSVAGAVRVYTGAEDQTADSLIVAVEGVAGAPAYRGTAYAVFENLQLGDFANRVPQFGFEVFADASAPTVGGIATDLFAAASVRVPDASELTATLDGYGVGGGATVGGALGQLAVVEPHDLTMDGPGLRLRPRGGAAPIAILQAEAGVHVGTLRGRTRAWTNAARQRATDAIEVAYFDPTRDYQAGQQRAVSGRGARSTKRYDLPAAVPAGRARALAERIARDAEVARATRMLALPYGRLGIEIGDLVTVDDDARPWRVRRAMLEGMVFGLELEALAGTVADVAATDAGRAAANAFAAQGPTLLRVLDLLAFNDDGGTAPRLWLAASGDGAWRASEMLVSSDGGASYTSLGVARRRALMGTVVDALPDGPADRWDEVASTEVVLANVDDWLTTATADAVLGGANLAAIGSELIAFRNAVATGPGRFRLSGLLRGRFGSEFETARHAAGEAFTLLDPARLLRADLGAIPLGTRLLLKAVGPLETASAVEAQNVTLSGANLRPFAPVKLSIVRDVEGALRLGWTRRSRTGRGWPDGADVPLGEASEQYLVTVTPAAGSAQSYSFAQESAFITAAQQTAQTGGLITAGTITVAQVSALVGPGLAATRQFQII